MISIVLSLVSYGQDLHNSQFYATPLTLNPALTGAINSQCRATGIVRDQWRSNDVNPITTYNASYEYKFSKPGDYFGLGGVLIQDQWNPGTNTLAVDNFNAKAYNSRVYLSGAYHKLLGEHQLSFGVQPGILYRYYSNDEAAYPEQYDRFLGDFDPNSAGGENVLFSSPQMIRFDLNAGLEWMADFYFFQAHAGIASFHLLKPNQAIFSDYKHRLNRLWIMTAGTKHAIGESWSIFPNIIYMRQGKSEKFHFGGGIEKTLGEGNWKHINLSGYARTSGALIGILGMGYKNFDFGFSYDAGLNLDLGPFAIDKAFEFSVVYKCNFDPELPSFYIPCNRY